MARHPRRASRLALALVVSLLAFGCQGYGSHEDVYFPVEEANVKPGINERYKSPDLAVGEYQERFETESREVFALREQIVAAIGIEAGDDVADIGAGTGIFTKLFSDAVGKKGKVYAVELAPNFIAHLVHRKNAEDWENVEVVTGSDRSVELERNTLDVAFVCDTYHHFEYPLSTLASLRIALRPGGRLVVLDFDRIPGVSSDWILEHVRAGQATVVDEIERAGFVLERELEDVPLEENYLLVFRSPS